MINTLNDTPQQFGAFFSDARLRPYAALVLRRLSEGHICADFSGTDLNAAAAAGLPHVGRAGERQPFILHNEKLYLQRYFHYESVILRRIRAFIRSGNQQLEERAAQLADQKDLVLRIFSADTLPGTEQVNWQLAAVICGFLNDFTIITGGPGTGKTTTVARLLTVLYAADPALRVALAAPTGKAALRMAESLQQAGAGAAGSLADKFAELQPQTVHRLLGYRPGSPYFRHDAEHPLPFQVIIVDEASMLDAALFAKLLSAVGEGCRLILLGDKDQLASVEAGSLLGDLCQTTGAVNRVGTASAAVLEAFDLRAPAAEAGTVLAGHIIELQHSRRFSADAGIGLLSKAVISGAVDVLAALIGAGGNEQVLIDTQYSSDVFEDFVEQYMDFIRAAAPLEALQALNRVRILCAVHGGEQGVARVNRRVEELLRQKKLLGAGDFYANRPVMVTGNNYELGLFNGDIGIVRPDADGELKVWFEDGSGGVRGLLPAYLPEVTTVFAMTIHKSQGSEYDQVMVMLPAVANERLMTRELLYTAVTRARKRVIIQAAGEMIIRTSSAAVSRASGIKERLNEIENGLIP